VTLTVGSLFSGIGGIDLGLERSGMTVKWHSEIQPYACQVLKKHWPTVPNLGNIKDIDWSTVEPVDLIAGGYPCQPFSLAGKRQGEKDERHLWPYFLRSISELRPRYALLENVRGHLTMGFDRVLADLAFIGYDAEWQLVPAASLGAPHRRERLIIVAYANNQQFGTSRDGSQSSRQTQTDKGSDELLNWIGGRSKTMADSDSKFLGEHWSPNDFGIPRYRWDYKCKGKAANDFRQWWETEPDVGRVAHGIPSRVDRLRGLGNAVVPQVAEYVGRLIMEAHNERPI
jgi:DNA (cytosine-5)-methyltransferase 1